MQKKNSNIYFPWYPDRDGRPGSPVLWSSLSNRDQEWEVVLDVSFKPTCLKTKLSTGLIWPHTMMIAVYNFHTLFIDNMIIVIYNYIIHISYITVTLQMHYHYNIILYDIVYSGLNDKISLSTYTLIWFDFLNITVFIIITDVICMHAYYIYLLRHFSVYLPVCFFPQYFISKKDDEVYDDDKERSWLVLIYRVACVHSEYWIFGTVCDGHLQ